MNSTQNLPVLFSMSDLEKMANTILKSKLFGMQTVEQTMTLMLVAQSEGMHPATAARDFHIISGRPSMKADAMLARFQQSGGIVEWQDYTDAKVAATFRHPQSPRPVLVEWTMEQAKRIGLAGKENWVKYPRAMLRARVISEGVRTCYPVISTGIYTPEETQDFASNSSFAPAVSVERDVTPEVSLPTAPITPTTGALEALSAKQQEVVMATAAAIRVCLAEDRPMDAYSLCETSGFENGEKVALWSLLDSKARAAIKRMAEAESAAKDGTVSAPAKKRLEALIKEHGLDREKVKAYCKQAYGKEHFGELTPAESADLEGTLQDLKEEQEVA